jgi:trk system potassium uptake protein
MKNTIFNVLGYVFLFMGLVLFLPALVSYLYKDNLHFLFLSIALIMFVFGFVMVTLFKKKDILNFKEIVIIVFFGWTILTFIGALPYYFSGYLSFIDSFFESVSGFTTTGATILENIDILPHSLIFWRSFSHWLGGLGIILFVIAIIPSFGLQSSRLFQTEVSGATVNNKLFPRIKDTALLLLVVYFSLTFLQIISLLFAGLNLFDSLIHTFGTVATGGFSSYNSSIGYYSSPLVHYIIALFMILSGINFILYCRFILGYRNVFLKNQEFRLYLIIISVYTIIISFNLWKSVFPSFEESFRMALFHVVSIMTTTGYTIVNYDAWPNLSKIFLFSLMFVGASIGSTGSSLKVLRILVILKSVKLELLRIIHPSIVYNIKVENEPLSQNTIRRILKFVIVYIFIFMIGILVFSFFDLDMISALSISAATLGNIGPGFGLIGPNETYAFLHPLAKLFATFLMILGRLEIFTILVIFLPHFWRK